MKKILLPLILILLLTFTLAGNCDWLSGWDNRIKLTTDNTKIDTANLTWFPVTVFLTGSQAEEIFSELDADADYMKVAFTKADGTTQLYAECELFDHSESLGIYHVSRDGWVIAYDADTDFYMYYDNDHADNDTYIGAINTTAGATVWDGNFKFVCHMVNDNGNVDDSTSNNNDGTKKGAGQPLEATGKIGQGQSFSSDYISVAADATLNPETGSFTVEAVAKPTSVINYRIMFDCRQNGNAEGHLFRINKTTGVVLFNIEDDGDISSGVVGGTDCSDGSYHYLVGMRDVGDDELRIYRDGISDATPVTDTTTATVNSTQNLIIGAAINLTSYPFAGILDELRLSKTDRSDAWIKATYNSLWDTLLTYGSEETSAVEVNAIFFGMNF